METFRCTGCGKIMETIPQCCGQDMVFNEEKNQLKDVLASYQMVAS